MQIIKRSKEPNIDPKLKAFEFQSNAVNAIKDLEYAAVFHEQGLGKSKIAIDLMLYWLKEKVVDTILLVTKKGLVHNWEREFKLHTHITPRLLDQNKNSNYFVFNSPARIMLAHYEVIESEKERFKLFLKTRNVAIIIDESAKIKNPTAQLTKSFFELSSMFKKRVIMTGTPVANRPYDIWAQIFFLDQGKSLGTNFAEFKKSTDLTNDLSSDLKKREDFENTIKDIYIKIRNFSVRELKSSGIIQLPSKEIMSVITDWEPMQYDLYRSIKDDMRANVIKDGVPQIDESDEILKRLLRLVQVASNPKLVDSSYDCYPGKYESLIGIIESIIGANEKCIIWTNYIENVEWLYQELKQFGTVRVHGKMKIAERNQAVDNFMFKDEKKILIATPASSKEGLTLTVANHVIFYDRNFSLDDYLQAQDRIHRISQTKTCYIYNFIMQDSIDEWIDALLESKHLSAQLTQGDITIQEFKFRMTYEFGDVIKNILNIENGGANYNNE